MTPKKPAAPDLFRIVEAFHLRLKVDYTPHEVLSYVCRLCLMETEIGKEIQHREHCPVLRLK
jgi:hypothetical protein